MRYHFPLYTLSTHASASLAGYDVDLNPTRNRFLKHVEEWCFLVPGPNGAKLVKSPNDWLALLKARGTEMGWFGHEANILGRYSGLLTLAGGDRWFWNFTESKVAEGPYSWLRGWAAAEKSPVPEPPPHADLRDLASQVRAPLEALCDFCREHRHEDGFMGTFESALALIDGLLANDVRVELPEKLKDLYPPRGFSREARLLAGALAQADVLGGMGSWNDWNAKTPVIQERFERVTRDYLGLMGPCLTAASQASRQ